MAEFLFDLDQTCRTSILGDIGRNPPRAVAGEQVGRSVRFTPRSDIGTQPRNVDAIID